MSLVADTVCVSVLCLSHLFFSLRAIVQISSSLFPGSMLLPEAWAIGIKETERIHNMISLVFSFPS